MDKKYLMNGLAALAIVAGISSCVKDVDGVNTADQEKAAKENAELQLGLTIPEGQTWEMSQASQVEANVNVDLTAGETYSVAVYSNDPFADGKGVVLAKGSVKSGSAFSESFTCGNDRQQLWIAVTDKNNYTLYKLANVENGKVSADFSEATAGSRSMRALSVNGDVYNKFPAPGDVASYFPTSIPDNAVEVSGLLAKYQGKTVETQYGSQTLYDLYAIYNYVIGAGFNLKITSAGTFDVGGCKNHDWDGTQQKDVYKYYNVYVDVPNNGEVIINRPQDSHFNLYVLNGNVKMGPNQASQWSADIISVGEGSTFTDTRNEVAANGGVRIFNKGIWNATNSEKYDIGNFCTFYNAGTLNVTGPLSYSPGDANTSYLVNYGNNAVLTAPSMTLNSAGNFFNSGTATITGETNVTQKDIYWVNNGKYTTGSMTFSAKNATFYNYCQLIVKGNAHMYDGEFNLMTDSYCEAATAEFDNFIVNMANNAGFKVLGDTKWEAQGDGTYQGFKATGSKAYVYLGGTATVAAHQRSMEFSGNVTCAIGAITDKGASNTGVQPTYVLNNSGVSRVEIKDVTFTAPTEEECAGTWKKGGTPKYETPQVYTYAFEDQTVGSDYDMNDVVLKVSYKVKSTNAETGEVEYDKNKLNVTLVAAGATYNIKVKIGETYLFGGTEIHEKFGVSKGVMVNTGNGKAQTASPQSDEVPVPAGLADEDGNIDFNELPVTIEVLSTDKTYVFPNTDLYPHAVMVPTDWAWPTERTNIREAYAGTNDANKVTIEGTDFPENSFTVWGGTAAASRNATMNGWFNHPVTGKVMTNSSNANSNN